MIQYKIVCCDTNTILYHMIGNAEDLGAGESPPPPVYNNVTTRLIWDSIKLKNQKIFFYHLKLSLYHTHQ